MNSNDVENDAGIQPLINGTFAESSPSQSQHFTLYGNPNNAGSHQSENREVPQQLESDGNNVVTQEGVKTPNEVPALTQSSIETAGGGIPEQAVPRGPLQNTHTKVPEGVLGQQMGSVWAPVAPVGCLMR